MTVRIIIENLPDSKYPVSVTNMTEHAWDGGKLGVENINVLDVLVAPSELKEFTLWDTRHLLIRERNDL